MMDSSLIIPPPSPNELNISPWVDEQIWGHRLWDSTSSWLLFLEFLTVAESCYRQGNLLDEGDGFNLSKFTPHKRMYLRNILFNNEKIFQIAERHADSASAWDEWLKWMREKAQGVSSTDFSYLRTRFHTFQQFASLVGMLRNANVESGANKRWTSRFVFPFGPNALYEDLKINPNSGTASRDYINFGRTGELLYLMFCRSSLRAELTPHIANMFEVRSPWNDLLELMQPGAEEDPSLRGKSYLPYKAHPIFNMLAEDWLRIFNLTLPGFDAYPHLVTLGALHVLLYQLNIALEQSSQEGGLQMICEVVAPKKTLVRELSSANYIENNLLPAKAVESYIDDIERSEEWQSALVSHGAFMKCRQILQDRVRWGEDAEDYDGPNDPGAMLSAFKAMALEGHRQHVANVHRIYGRDVGLVSKRGTNKFRYAPTDSLLKTLILSNVDTRMELNEFLNRIYERYGLVFGDREAERVLGKDDFDKKAFQANARRLEQRLGSLGMLRRLSDGCAYIENPYGRRA
jgi:hypothetical protein